MGQLTCSITTATIYTKDMHKRFEKRCILSSIPTERTKRMKRTREQTCVTYSQATLQPPLEGKQGKSYEYKHGQAAL